MRPGSPNTISLTGAGVAPPTVASLSAPSSVEFGDVTVGSQGSKTITLVSNGTAPVTVKSITVAGAEFSGISGGVAAGIAAQSADVAEAEVQPQ